MSIFKKNYFFFFLIFLFLFIFPVFAIEAGGTITGSSPQWAWGDKLGWINFACDNCEVDITNTEINKKLTGHIWSRQYGWINLSPTGSDGVTNSCVGADANLSGKAWSKSLGWLDFEGASIDENGNFTGTTQGGSTKAGKINFDCDDYCGVSTDFRCASPALVSVTVTDTTIPLIVGSITISNEGFVDTEYSYEWCVVSNLYSVCGGGDDIDYGSDSKDILPGVIYNVDKTVTVNNTGSYYFKVRVQYGGNSSTASDYFTAIEEEAGGGGGGGGGGTSENYDTADLNRDHIVNSIDFSILLFFWKSNPPFSNIYVDINKDGKVDPTDFSIMLSQWGRKTI